MSNYQDKAINPTTGMLEPADFLDFGREGYKIRFADGKTYPEDVVITSRLLRDPNTEHVPPACKEAILDDLAFGLCDPPEQL